MCMHVCACSSMIGKWETICHNWSQCEISSLATTDIDLYNNNLVTLVLENIIIVGSCCDDNTSMYSKDTQE